MNNYLGIAGGAGSMRGGMGQMMDAPTKRRQKSTPSLAMPMQNPMAQMRPQPSTTTMTHNGMYNMASIAPPPIGSKPPRRSTLSRFQQAPIPMPQPIAVPVPGPVNRPGMRTGIQIMSTPAPTISDLATKLSNWNNQKMKKVQFDEPSRSEPEGQSHTQPQPGHPASDHQKEIESLRHEVESLRKQVQSLSESLGALDPNHQSGVVKNVEQVVQKVQMEHSVNQESISQMKIEIKAMQCTLDGIAESKAEVEESQVTSELLDNTVAGLSEEMKKEVDDLKSFISDKLKSVTDRLHWFYAEVAQDVVAKVNPNLSQPPIPQGSISAGTVILVSYPQAETPEGVWLRFRGISDNATTIYGWVPVWLYSSQVLDKYRNKKPPQNSPKDVYLKNFSMVPSGPETEL